LGTTKENPDWLFVQRQSTPVLVEVVAIMVVTKIVVEMVALAIDELAGADVDDGVLVEEAVPSSVESPHDTVSSATKRLTATLVLDDRAERSVMPEPYVCPMMIDRDQGPSNRSHPLGLAISDG
jgi:hypothetical protein